MHVYKCLDVTSADPSAFIVDIQPACMSRNRSHPYGNQCTGISIARIVTRRINVSIPAKHP